MHCPLPGVFIYKTLVGHKAKTLKQHRKIAMDKYTTGIMNLYAIFIHRLIGFILGIHIFFIYNDRHLARNTKQEPKDINNVRNAGQTSMQ
jgi:hypothetical protein